MFQMSEDRIVQDGRQTEDTQTGHAPTIRGPEDLKTA